jgi:hypothetical protein
MSVMKIASGQTVPGNTAWQTYPGPANGIYVDVDTSTAGFKTIPLYFTSIGGISAHWAAVGATSIYQPTNSGFRIYVRWIDGTTLSPAQANSWQWHICWLGVEGRSLTCDVT